MRKITKKIILIVFMILIILSINSFQKLYANSETEELILMLDEMKPEFGDMKQFKEVIDSVYNDLNSANKVDKTLKTNLKKDIEKLAEVEGINPMLSAMLIGELNGQVDSLTDETLPQMKEEIIAIKEWADANQDDPEEEPPTPETTPDPEEPPITETPSDPEETPKPTTPSDPSISDKDFPYAGIRNVTCGLVLIVMVIFAFITKKKYKNLKDI